MKVAWWISLAALGVLVLSVAFTPDTLPGVSSCTFYNWTGVPCAGCGMTRAFCSISHGEWAAAWAYHPLSYPLYAVCLAAASWPAIAKLAPGARLRPAVLLGLALAYVLALAAFGVWRAWPALAARF